MKLIRQVFGLLVCVIGLSSCASLLTNKNVLMNVQKGMSQKEVSSILGKPDYRRFDNELEEWEYSKPIMGNAGYTTIIVGFVNDRVVNMDSFQGETPVAPHVAVVAPNRVDVNPPIYPSHPQGNRRYMDDRDFQDLYNKVKSKPFKDDQLELLSIGASNNRFSCKQCVRMMSIYTFDDEKLQVLGILASKIVDRQNYEEIINALDFISSHEKAKNMLGIKK